MFSRSRKMLPYLRALALLLVCFQVLASSRGLVPSICLTLRDGGTATAAEQESSCCVAKTPSCCESKSGKAPKPAGKESPHCAFCFLAKAYTETPDFFQYPFWQEIADAPYVQGPGSRYERPADDRTLGRAPPFQNA